MTDGAVPKFGAISRRHQSPSLHKDQRTNTLAPPHHKTAPTTSTRAMSQGRLPHGCTVNYSFDTPTVRTLPQCQRSLTPPVSRPLPAHLLQQVTCYTPQGTFYALSIARLPRSWPEPQRHLNSRTASGIQASSAGGNASTSPIALRSVDTTRMLVNVFAITN